jgi:hypothetical protein
MAAVGQTRRSSRPWCVCVPVTIGLSRRHNEGHWSFDPMTGADHRRAERRRGAAAGVRMPQPTCVAGRCILGEQVQ